MRFKPNQEVVCINSDWYSIAPFNPGSPPSYPVENSLYVVRAESPAKSDFIELQEFPGNYWGQNNFESVVSDEIIKELLEHQLTEA